MQSVELRRGITCNTFGQIENYSLEIANQKGEMKSFCSIDNIIRLPGHSVMYGMLNADVNASSIRLTIGFRL